MSASLTEPEVGPSDRLEIDEHELKARIDGVLNRHSAVGLGVGVVRDGRLESFDGRGFADIASNTNITEDTVFRIAGHQDLHGDRRDATVGRRCGRRGGHGPRR